MWPLYMFLDDTSHFSPIIPSHLPSGYCQFFLYPSWKLISLPASLSNKAGIFVPLRVKESWNHQARMWLSIKEIISSPLQELLVFKRICGLARERGLSGFHEFGEDWLLVFLPYCTMPPPACLDPAYHHIHLKLNYSFVMESSQPQDMAHAAGPNLYLMFVVKLPECFILLSGFHSIITVVCHSPGNLHSLRI